MTTIADQLAALVKALEQSRFYVKAASIQTYDGTNGGAIRASALHVLTRIDEALAAYNSAQKAEGVVLPEPLAMAAQFHGEWRETINPTAQPIYAADQLLTYGQQCHEAGRQQGMEQARAEIDAVQTSAYAEGRKDQAEDPPACPHCGGAGGYEVPSNAGPDPEMLPINCEHCGGTGCLNDAYRGVCALLAVEQGKYQKAISELWAIKNKLSFPVISDPLPANTVRRIKRDCDAKGLDLIAFAWAVQKESHRVNFAPPAASSAQEPSNDVQFLARAIIGEFYTDEPSKETLTDCAWKILEAGSPAIVARARELHEKAAMPISDALDLAFSETAPARLAGATQGEAVRVAAWIRGVLTPDTPMGSAEYDEECCPGEDRPPGEGWVPLYPQAPAATQPEPTNEQWLQELLRRARGYVAEASTRYYDGTDGAAHRQSAKALLEKIEAALSATPPVAVAAEDALCWTNPAPNASVPMAPNGVARTIAVGATQHPAPVVAAEAGQGLTEAQKDKLRTRLGIILGQINQIEHKYGTGGARYETVQEQLDAIVKDHGLRPLPSFEKSLPITWVKDGVVVEPRDPRGFHYPGLATQPAQPLSRAQAERIVSALDPSDGGRDELAAFIWALAGIQPAGNGKAQP